MTGIRKGDTVHQVSLGSADGTYPPECRPAIVISTGQNDYDGQFDLFVITTNGSFHDREVPYAMPGDHDGLNPGTWHTREECNE